MLTFLFVRNGYLVAVVILSPPANRTGGLGGVSGRVAVSGVAAMLPPIGVLAVLHRFVRLRGVTDAAAR